VKASEVRAAIKGVVESHAVYNTWYSSWSIAKDMPSEKEVSFVCWDQWNSRANLNADMGPERTQLVRLVVASSLSTERSAEDRDVACEAADEAALQIALKVARDYPELGVDNVVITTQFDEGPALETGVLLSFTVTGSICYDAAAFPESEE
jgi:hypothetical protein